MNLVFHISEDVSEIELKHCASSKTSVLTLVFEDAQCFSSISSQLGLVASLIQFKSTKYFRDDLKVVTKIFRALKLDKTRYQSQLAR